MKEELDRLVEKDVLVFVTEPTECVSQMAVVHKPSGKLRICIDSQHSSTNITNCQYLMMYFLSSKMPKCSASLMCEKLIGVSD